MLIQGFAENSVKHAFYGIKYKGHIKVTVTSNTQGTSIVIEDNGIGIVRSKKLAATSGSKMGTQLLQDQIRQINKLYKRNISIKIMDGPFREGMGSGTTVEIHLR